MILYDIVMWLLQYIILVLLYYTRCLLASNQPLPDAQWLEHLGKNMSSFQYHHVPVTSCLVGFVHDSGFQCSQLVLAKVLTNGRLTTQHHCIAAIQNSIGDITAFLNAKSWALEKQTFLPLAALHTSPTLIRLIPVSRTVYREKAHKLTGSDMFVSAMQTQLPLTTLAASRGPGRCWILDHALQHLRGNNHRLSLVLITRCSRFNPPMFSQGSKHHDPPWEIWFIVLALTGSILSGSHLPHG